MSRTAPRSPWRLASALALGTLLVACQRQEAPTPGVAGGTANPPAAASSGPAVVPTVPESPDGRGKSPGVTTPPGTSGAGGTMPAPTSEPAQPAASDLPAVPPASAPGTAVPTPPASAPAG